MKQLKINIPGNEEIVNKKIKEEFTLKNATLYGGYNLFSDYLNVINLTNRFIAVVEASPMDFVIPREFSTRPNWLDGFDKDFMKLRYQ